MRRRAFMGAAVGVLGIGGSGAYLAIGGNTDGETAPNTTTTPSDETDVPDEIKALQPLARAFKQRLGEHFQGRVYITPQAELAVEYQSKAETNDELRTEFAQIADLYATTIKNGEYQPVTLTLVVGEVQGIVPVPSLKAYVRGEINNEAFLKTIEVTDIERAG